jgi:hypothetical protein
MRILHSATRHGWNLAIILALTGTPSLAMAADQGVPRLGMAPGEPQVRSATPSIPFGVNPAESKEFVLDFHGYLLLPATLGVENRPVTLRVDPNAGPTTTPAGSTTVVKTKPDGTIITGPDGQPVPAPMLPTGGGTVLHAPPLMAQNLRSFEYTAAVPTPWAQLNFIYGNKTVAGTVIMAATSFSDPSGYNNLVGQLGVSDAFIATNLTKYFGFPFLLSVGAQTGRYGAMGSYDAGRYATPLIARTNTIGETITTGYKLGEFFLLLEQGLGGQLGRPPVGLVPAGYNDYANGNVGATFVNHAHLGLAYGGLGRLGFHYLSAFTKDDQVNGGQVPNGSITVLGTDLNLTAGRAGHLYLGLAHAKATNAAVVSSAIEILNARGGPELMAQYLGPNSNGNGSLTTYGAQYDLSVSKLVFGPLYTGVSSDILISLFSVGTSVTSDDPAYNGVFKVKAGGEVTYLMMSWLGVSERFDHVRLHGGDSKKAFSIYSSRVLFHTGWKSRDEFALQYSYFQSGSDIIVPTGYPLGSGQNANPDRHVFTLSGTFWW